MSSVLNREWTDDNGNHFRVIADAFSGNPMTAAEDLSKDEPLIIGSLGHAMVLTAVTYVRDYYGRGQTTSAIVRDPWPFNQNRRVLTPQEWAGTTMLLRIRVRDVPAPTSTDEWQ
jgi:hypothetical protein